MNIYDLMQAYEPSQLAKMSSRFYPAKIQGTEKSVAAGATADDDVSIPAGVGFLCTRITGRFTTGHSGADDGVCRMSCKISDQGRGSLPFFQDFVLMDLFLTPGRYKTLSGAATHSLFYPDEFVHFFLPNTNIHIEYKSAATTTANTGVLLFSGYKVKVSPEDKLL